MTSQRELLGERIRELRRAAGLTLEGLSARLAEHGQTTGISVQHLSQIERGTTWPSPDLVHALDSVLESGNQLIYLLREAKVPTQPTASITTIEVIAHLFYPLFVD